MPRTKQTGKEPVPKKMCPVCKKTKAISSGFYKSVSPLFSNDDCVPICISCVKNDVVNDDGTINLKRFKVMMQRLDKPLYWSSLESAYNQYRKEHGFLSDDEIAKHGKEIVGLYFKNLNSLRQNKDKSFADSEKDNFISQGNMSKSEYDRINRKYNKVNGASTENIPIVNTCHEADVIDSTQLKQNMQSTEKLIYSDKWLGDYSEKDIAYLDKYYEGLNRDYKILTENHRDYARKIAKASLQMDKCFNDMINGVEGADIKYKNAREAFDTLSKSAKFSESTRSVNDVGISSFSKITEMVENHNWIPEHKPIEKDDIDKLLDYLSTITKSL